MTYLPLYKDLKAIYNAYIEKNARSKKGKVKMWKEQYCTAMPIVLCDLKVTTFIVLP